MENKKLDIKIESEKNSFIIEEKEVSKICIITPFFFDYTSQELDIKDEKIHLHIYDQVAVTCLGDRNFMESHYSINPLTKVIKILVPKNTLNTLNINLENGSLFLKQMNLKQANISCVRGNIKTINSSIEDLSIDSYLSSISIENLESRNCSLKTKTGNIDVKGIYPDFLSLETGTGDIHLHFDDSTLDHTLLDINCKGVNAELKPYGNHDVQKVIRCVSSYGHVNSNIF